jgi:adenine phosphoribosyltransferase
MDLRSLLRDVPDFPKPGIVFKDITPLLRNHAATKQAMEDMARPFLGRGIDAVAGIESRGFIFGSAIALELECGFIPIRKPGKLPAATIRLDYALEYGSDAIEIHADALTRGERVILVDDVLATGGTLAAGVGLLRQLGAEVVGAVVLLELAFLAGRRRLDVPVHAVLSF